MKISNGKFEKRGGKMKEKLVIAVRDWYISGKIEALRKASINLSMLINDFIKSYEIPDDKDAA